MKGGGGGGGGGGSGVRTCVSWSKTKQFKRGDASANVNELIELAIETGWNGVKLGETAPKWKWKWKKQKERKRERDEGRGREKENVRREGKLAAPWNV